MPVPTKGQNPPARHHYLPQFYLRNFMKDGELWVRDREEKETRKQSPRTSAWKEHYYSFKKGEELDHRIEHALADVERDTKPIIDALARRDTIDDDQKLTLSLFVSLLMTRVPEFQKFSEAISTQLMQKLLNHTYGSVEALRRSLEEYEKDTGDKLEHTAEQMYEAYSKGIVKIVPTRVLSLSAMMDNAPKMATNFAQMIWVVAHAPQGTSFITSDNPLIIAPPRQEIGGFFQGTCGILTPGALKIVALSQSCCLLMQDKGEGIIHRTISRNTTRNLNRQIAAEVDRFFFGRDKALLDSLAKITKDESLQRSSRVLVA